METELEISFFVKLITKVHYLLRKWMHLTLPYLRALPLIFRFCQGFLKNLTRLTLWGALESTSCGFARQESFWSIGVFTPALVILFPAPTSRELTKCWERWVLNCTTISYQLPRTTVPPYTISYDPSIKFYYLLPTVPTTSYTPKTFNKRIYYHYYPLLIHLLHLPPSPNAFITSTTFNERI